MQAVSTSAALHSVYRGPRCLTDSLSVDTAIPGEEPVHVMRATDYRLHTMLAPLLYFMSGALDSTPHTRVASALPKEPSFQPKTSRIVGKTLTPLGRIHKGCITVCF